MKSSVFIGTNQYSLTQFSELSLEKEQQWLKPAQTFVKGWINGQKEFPINTSGSTGRPKTIVHQRDQMIASAEATIKTLRLSKDTTALLCLNAAYIGGQMMLLRAMWGGWNIEIVAPSSVPSDKASLERYDFTAMAPLQVSTLLENPGGRSFLNRIEKIIIGGAPISMELLHQIEQLESQCYHTYGMTETVSHIALKKLNGPDKSDWFEVIGDNVITTDERDCLSIKGSATNHAWVVTNDRVEISSNRFKWLGRVDFVVNSGGVKIQIEKVEQELQRLLPPAFGEKLIVWKRPNQRLGEELIGLTTDSQLINYIDKEKETLRKNLPDYHFPKRWFHVHDFHRTEGGKIDRNTTFAAVID